MSEKRVLAKKSDITYFGDVVRSKKGITNSLSLEQVKQGVSELKGDSDEWQGDFKNQGNVLFKPQEYNGEYIEEGDNLTVPSGTLEITENGEYDVIDKAKVNINVKQAEDAITQALQEDY